MGSVFRQAGRQTWMVKYYRDGRPTYESSGTDDWQKARGILRTREAGVERGEPVTAGRRLRFDEAVKAVVADYQANGRRTQALVERRIAKHLTPVFTGRRLASLSTAEVRAYIKGRQDAGAANATVNRELAILRRAFVLAVHDGRLTFRPHVPMLEEHNTRAGFFERDQAEAIRRHAPAWLQPVITFAYVTGWRIQSEILPLEWRQVDLTAEIVRLEPGHTKNDEGRTFPFADVPELRAMLKAQRAAADRLARAGRLVPWVFHDDGRRLVDDEGRASYAFRQAWRAAAKAAGCPGRIPHDFRRTAVRNLIRAGVPEKTAMLLTGHKTRAVFDRYDIVNEADLRAATARLGAAAESRPGRRRGRVSR